MTTTSAGTARIVKAAGAAILDGGEVWWDYSADAATYKKVNDRDFYLGTAVGDWSSTSTMASTGQASTQASQSMQIAGSM